MNMTQRKQHFEAWRATWAQPHATRHYLDAYLAHIDASPMLREAYAHAAWYECVPLDVCPGEMIAGVLRHNEAVYFHYGSGTVVNDAAVDTLAAEGDTCIQVEAERVRAIAYKPADPAVYDDAELRSIAAGAATSTWFGGHMILDFERILRIGLDGYARDLERCRRIHTHEAAFYDALSIQLRAMQGLIERYAEVERDNPAVADALARIAHQPPRGFRDAVQLVWILHLLNGTDSFGRFDHYLDPFYRADVADGTLDYDAAKAIVCEMLLKVEAVESIQNMTIGGTDADGNDFYTPLTRIIIDVTRELGYKGPNLCLRVTQSMPVDIWDAALNCIASGIGLPALYNDSLYVTNLVRHGVPLEHARGYCLAGCSQIMIPGLCNFYNDVGIYNAAKVAELALYGGYDPLTDTQVSSQTYPTEFETFDALYRSFCEQLEYYVGLEVSLHEKELRYRASCEGYNMRTLFIRDCLSKGENIFGGGARYNNIELELIGITNAADHLYAIKRAVYDDKRYTLDQVREALRADFDGYADVRAYLKRLPKFGNDIPEVDALRADVARRLYAAFNASEACLGGVYVPGEVIFVAHEYCGANVGATADGRHARTVLADSAGASQGYDRNGPTALMNSVLTLPVGDYLLTSVVLNLLFLPSMFGDERTRGNMRDLFVRYFAQGGQQLQINVCDAEVLKQARRNPDAYRSLVVRVGGYSDYFTRLSKALQEEIILRTAQRI